MGPVGASTAPHFDCHAVQKFKGFGIDPNAGDLYGMLSKTAEAFLLTFIFCHAGFEASSTFSGSNSTYCLINLQNTSHYRPQSLSFLFEATVGVFGVFPK